MIDVHRLPQTQLEERIAFDDGLSGFLVLGVHEPKRALRCVLGFGTQSATRENLGALSSHIVEMLVNMSLPKIQALGVVAKENSEKHGIGLLVLAVA